MIAALGAALICVALARDAGAAPRFSGWCPKVAVAPRPFSGTGFWRIRVHNMRCSTATLMLRRYMRTGRDPSGYTCAANVLYCWSKDGAFPRTAAHWWRAYPTH